MALDTTQFAMLGRLTNWARETYQEQHDFFLLALPFDLPPREYSL